MPTIDVIKDPANLSMCMVVKLDTTPERAWQLWADPRQLERWWGPPMYPATVVDHDLVPGGKVNYYMTSPEGETFGGWWEVLAVDAPNRLELRDGFADANGAPNDSMPSGLMTVTFTPADEGGTVMSVDSIFPSAEAMEQLLEMGQEEGMVQAMGQIDAILAEG